MRILLTCCFSLLFVLPSIAQCEEQIEPKLSPNAEVLSKLRDLPANHGVLLGEATVMGEFNEVAKHYRLHETGPRGRDFTIKMAWAPDRKRVLFCGANHNVPHRINDVWEFDLGALTWAMLYAPDNPRDYTGLGKDYSDVQFKDGILITKRGGPAIIGHSWWGLTYDPNMRALLLMNTWVTNKKKAVESLGGDPEDIYAGAPLWAFYPKSKQWEMLKTPLPAPKAPFGGMLTYVPDLKGDLWHTNNWQMRASWLFDPEKRTWEELKTNSEKKDFEAQAPNPEQVGYYDPQRKLIIVHRHYDTHHFDPQTLVWQKVISTDKESEEQLSKVPYGHDAYSPMYFDPASGHGLLIEFKTNKLWAYDPDNIQWTQLTPEGDPMPDGNKRLMYIDPEHNVLVVIQGTTVWAYRYTE